MCQQRHAHPDCNQEAVTSDKAPLCRWVTSDPEGPHVSRRWLARPQEMYEPNWQKKGTSNRLTSWFLHSVGNSFLWLSFLHSASLKVSIHMGQRHWFYSESPSPKSRNWHWNLKLSNEEYYCRVNGSSEAERGGSHLWAQHLRGDGRQIRSLRSSLATEEVQDQPELHGTLPPPPTNAKTSMQTKNSLIRNIQDA